MPLIGHRRFSVCKNGQSIRFCPFFYERVADEGNSRRLRQP